VNHRPELSSWTVRRIDWQKIGDTTRAALDFAGGSRGVRAESPATPPFDPHVIREAFASVKREFRTVLKPLRTQMKLASGLVILSLAATITGAAFAVVHPWMGSAVSVAGIGSMFGFLTRMWQLAKDQAMLELIPTRYELALQLATSPDQFSDILNEFMRESTSIRCQTSR
jgi:hypothetical protein